MKRARLKSSFIFFGALVGLFPLFFSWVGCGSQSGIGGRCESDADCLSGLVCRFNRCRKPYKNKPPVAIISVKPLRAYVGEEVSVDGSQSKDPENQLLTYFWSLRVPQGSKAKLKDPKAIKTSFVPDVEGVYVVQLIVSDGKLKSRPSPPVSVKAEKPENSAPIADAGEDQKVLPGTKVTLDGTKSFDPDDKDAGYKILKFNWKFSTKPTGSKAALDKPTDPKPSFVADVRGKYVVSLVVTDPDGKDSVEDTVTVEAIPGLNKIPKLSNISPTSSPIETTVEVTLTGSDFVDGCRVFLGVRRFPTKFVSDKEVKATFDLRGLTPGKEKVYVVNPNGKKSNELSFEVKDILKPIISKLEPDQAPRGAKLTLRVLGKNFIKASIIRFQKTPLPTKFVSDTELHAKLDLTQTFEGKYEVSVASPGGRISEQKIFFTVTPPLPPPVLRVLNPPNGKAGEKIAFSVHGQGFAKGAVIMFDGKPIPSKRIRRDEIDADPHLDLTNVKEGEYDVWVRNPDGKDSNKMKFLVIGGNPTPKISRILPFTIYIGETVKLAIHGERFDPKGAKFFIGKREIPLNKKRSSVQYLEAILDTTKQKWSPADYDAYVVNPGNKKSNTFKLTITYPTPTLDYISPGGWSTQCGTDVYLIGSNFVKYSKVHFGSSMTFEQSPNAQYKLTLLSSTKMKLTLKKGMLNVTTYKVYVSNGPNAKSDTVDFSVISSAPVPELSEIRPASAPADTVVEITVRDNPKSPLARFKKGAVVLFNGKPYPTNCSITTSSYFSSRCTATVDLFGVKPGTYEVRVMNACTNASQPLKFLVTPPPTPYISKVEPVFSRIGDSVVLKIKGINFAKNHTLYIDNKAVDSVFVSPEEIKTKYKYDFSKLTSPKVLKIRIEHQNGKKTDDFLYSVLDKQQTLVITGTSPAEFTRGKVYAQVKVIGRGFTKNTKLYFDGKPIPVKFLSASELETQLNFSTIKVGTYFLQAEEGQSKSNYYPIFAPPLPPPVIRYISPSSVVKDGSKTSISLYISGSNFCFRSSFFRCQSPPIITIIGPDKKDYSSFFNISYSYPTSVRGTFNFKNLPEGTYFFYVSLPTGEKSSPALFEIKPPPPPVITGVSPPNVYRGNSKQYISVSGNNLIDGDIVVFNNDIFNRSGGTLLQGNLVTFIDLSKIKYPGKYPIHVERCLDKNCKKVYKSKPVYIQVVDPPCIGFQCKTDLPPAGSEACYNAGGYCRPICKTDSDCKKLKGAPANAKCKSGFCM